MFGRMTLVATWAALLLSLPTASAQPVPPAPSSEAPDEAQWLEERDLARDRFELSRTTPAQLAQLRITAARLLLRHEEAWFQTGRVDGTTLREARRMVLRARTRPAPPNEDRRVLEQTWRDAWWADRLVGAMFEVGRTSEGDYYASKYRLHTAALNLALTRPKK